MSVLVIGGAGQLGLSLMNCHSHKHAWKFCDVMGSTIEVKDTICYLDATDLNQILRYFQEFNPSYVINCAAWTDVDGAEDPKNYYKVKSLNEGIVDNLVYACRISKKHPRLIHISSDYVFNGEGSKPYVEIASSDPLNFYGHTKRNAELKILNDCEDYLIIRTQWLVSQYGKNFVKTMDELMRQDRDVQVVCDQIGSITYAGYLAHFISMLVDEVIPWNLGVYNYSSEGVCSWYDVAQAIKTLGGYKSKVEPVMSYQYRTKANRPLYTVLSKTAIKNDFGIKLPHWFEALDRCLRAYHKLRSQS